MQGTPECHRELPVAAVDSGSPGSAPGTLLSGWAPEASNSRSRRVSKWSGGGESPKRPPSQLPL